MKTKKYLTYIKTSLQEAIHKKIDLFGYTITTLLSLLATLLFWNAVYTDTSKVQGYDITQIVIYFILINLIGYLNQSNTINDIAYGIRQGNFSQKLLKPQKIDLHYLSRLIGNKIYRVGIVIPVYVLVLLTVSKIFGWVDFELTNIIAGSLILFIGFLINFYIDLTIGYLGFWFTIVWFLAHLKGVITQLLGGRNFPLALLPAGLFLVNSYLPFRFIYFTPLDYFLGNRSIAKNFAHDLLISALWLILIILISHLVLKKGVKKYEAYGN